MFWLESDTELSNCVAFESISTFQLYFMPFVPPELCDPSMNRSEHEENSEATRIARGMTVIAEERIWQPDTKDSVQLESGEAQVRVPSWMHISVPSGGAFVGLTIRWVLLENEHVDESPICVAVVSVKILVHRNADVRFCGIG